MFFFIELLFSINYTINNLSMVSIVFVNSWKWKPFWEKGGNCFFLFNVLLQKTENHNCHWLMYWTCYQVDHFTSNKSPRYKQSAQHSCLANRGRFYHWLNAKNKLRQIFLYKHRLALKNKEEIELLNDLFII